VSLSPLKLSILLSIPLVLSSPVVKYKRQMTGHNRSSQNLVPDHDATFVDQVSGLIIVSYRSDHINGQFLK
jgi:hypothetical protein